MPDEPERCPRHASAPVVGTCDVCGEPLCITCAVPVRGRVLGPRCLEAELGDPPAPPPALPTAPDPVRRLADAALLATLLTTTLPWSGVGLGAGPFGAWGTADPRWASVVVLASLAGSGMAFWWRMRGGRDARRADRVSSAATLTATGAAMLAIIVPPPYTSPAIGPWAAAVVGALASAASIAVLRREGAFA